MPSVGTLIRWSALGKIGRVNLNYARAVKLLGCLNCYCYLATKRVSFRGKQNCFHFTATPPDGRVVYYRARAFQLTETLNFVPAESLYSTHSVSLYLPFNSRARAKQRQTSDLRIELFVRSWRPLIASRRKFLRCKLRSFCKVLFFLLVSIVGKFIHGSVLCGLLVLSNIYSYLCW